MPLPRRVLSAVTLSALLSTPLAACGSDQSYNDAGESSSSSSSAGPTGTFPQTVDTKFGRVTVKSQPRRVAVVGFDDQDFVFAFGVKPVLARAWAGQEVVQPWAKKAIGDFTLKGTDLGNQTIDIEKVAASKPDLIIGVYSGMPRSDYDKLSRIAPVITQRSGYIDYGQPWDVTTKEVGQALGQPDKADQLVNQVQAKFDAAKKANPSWRGRSLAIGTYSEGKLASFAAQDNRTRFFTDLGFKANPTITTLAGKQFYVYLPLEKANLLDQDVLVWDQLSYTAGGKATIKKTPALANLKAMKQDRALYVEPRAVQTAFGWQTILSIPYALDGIVPALRKVKTPSS